MCAFVRNHLHVPVHSIVRSRAWLNSEFARIRSGDSVFRDVRDVISSELGHMLLLDLKQFWLSQEDDVFWQQPEIRKLGLHYMSHDESVSTAGEFLHYQFEGIEEVVVNFLRTLSQVLNRETKNKICLEDISPPSAGKNWWSDTLFSDTCHTNSPMSDTPDDTVIHLSNCRLRKTSIITLTKHNAIGYCQR
jgi:hypothetical protein